MTCTVDGCERSAHWWIIKETRTRRVCSKCRDELIALYDWDYGGTVK